MQTPALRPRRAIWSRRLFECRQEQASVLHPDRPGLRPLQGVCVYTSLGDSRLCWRLHSCVGMVSCLHRCEKAHAFTAPVNVTNPMTRLGISCDQGTHPRSARSWCCTAAFGAVSPASAQWPCACKCTMFRFAAHSPLFVSSCLVLCVSRVEVPARCSLIVRLATCYI